MIVIEDCEVRSEAASPLDDSTFGIVLSFGGGQLQHLATYTEVRLKIFHIPIHSMASISLSYDRFEVCIDFR